MVTSRAKIAFITAALVGCTVVSAPTDEDQTGSVSSALFTPFTADFDKNLTTSTKWGTFEEIVNNNPCYGAGIASVRRVTSQFHGTSGGSLAVTANYTRSNKSNHVLAQKSLSTASVDVALDYVTWAMIDPLAGDDVHEGQTGPELSIQRTKLLTEGWRTMTGGVQYVANKWSGQGTWQLWTDVGNGTAGWVPIGSNVKLTKGTWYKIALGVDYGTRMYRSLSVSGPGVDIALDLSTRPIVREVKFSQDALELTLESENAYSNCGANGPFEYTVFYDDVSLTAPGAPPSTGKTCTGSSTQACGNCGTQSRTCTKGKWSAWGTCVNQGVCAPLSTQACGNGGTQTCGPTCAWGVCTGEVCTPRTCADQGKNCGPSSDGCGGVLDCGSCTAPATCGGGGIPNVCGTTCIPKTCQELGANCGSLADGCGGFVNCGTCASPQSCGGGGTPNVCGGSSGGSCVPKTCAQLGATCGPIADGCGGLLPSCGSCIAPNICGGGGVPYQCGGGGGPGFPTCTPLTCQQQGAACGTIGDGCGNAMACGSCPSGMACGAGNQCVPSACTPRTCSEVGAACGLIADGCGATIDCGTCPSSQTCGGGGVPNQCACRPTTCQEQNLSCGPFPDGCGGTLNCGTCPAGQTCLAWGVCELLIIE